MKHTATTIYLAIAGLLLLVIGSAILLAPHTFHGSNGIVLGNNPSLLSEVRAPGGLLAASGALALISLIRSGVRLFAAQLMILVFGSFGSARLISVALDGIPSSSIIGATILEFIVAAVGIAILWRQHTVSDSKLAIPVASQ